MKNFLCRFVCRRHIVLMLLMFLPMSLPALCAPIHIAVRSLDFQRLKEILAVGSDEINLCDEAGIAPLHYAAGLGAEDFVEALLENGADPLAVDKYGNTALHWAANIDPLCPGVDGGGGNHFCYLGVIARLASAGIPINAPNLQGRTPLHLAASHGVVGILNLLLELGGDPNVTDASGSTPLHLAVGKNAALTAALLLSKKADPAQRDKEGRTCLEKAREAGNSELLEFYKAFFKHQNQNASSSNFDAR